MSLTRRRNPSKSRMPVPYNRRATKPATPFICARTACTSVCVRTTGRRRGRFARVMLSIHSNCRPKTSRYKKSKAASA